MTNIDRAAQAILQSTACTATEVSQTLADEGLLMPDLPKPTRWKQNEEPEWDACETTISPVGYEGRVLVEEPYDRWEASAANIRALAHALLAAANYAEERANDR